MSTPRDRRLVNELENMRKLQSESEFFAFEAEQSDVPERYLLHFSCFGLVDKPNWGKAELPPDWRRRPPPWLGNRHTAMLYLPAEYPIVPPQVRFVTPIYHPNIRFLGDNQKELERLSEHVGGYENLNRLFQEDSEMQAVAAELFAAYICLDGLKSSNDAGYYTPRLTLRDICIELGQMIMFQRYNTESPLNKEAASWTLQAEELDALDSKKKGEARGHRLPIDNRDFVTQAPVVRILQTPVEIEVVGEA